MMGPLGSSTPNLKTNVIEYTEPAETLVETDPTLATPPDSVSGALISTETPQTEYSEGLDYAVTKNTKKNRKSE